MEPKDIPTLIKEMGAKISGALRPLAALEEREMARLNALEARVRAREQAPPQPPVAPAGVKADLRCPVYDGTGEVKAFIRQFEGVTAVAGWMPDIRLLQLRSSLTGGATDLSQAPTEDRILAALQLRAHSPGS